MIYMKDGKLLVTAGGDLATTCYEYGNDCDVCEPDPFPNGQTPKYFDVTFAGVTLCATRSWPGGVDLNTTWQLTQNAINFCKWGYIDANWDISLYVHTGGAFTTLRALDIPGNFYYDSGNKAGCYFPGIGVVSIINIGSCGGNIWGHSGTADWDVG